MHIITIVGVIAAFCSMASFVPQAWKIIRTRETKDISAGMFSLTVAAFVSWCIYGALLGEWPLIVSNGVCLALAAFILTMILLPRRKKEAVADAIEMPVNAVAGTPGSAAAENGQARSTMC